MISVIIPTRNRAEEILCVLPSYLDQDSLLEIIIVDDSADCKHRQHMEEMAKGNKQLVLVQDENPCGLPAARNRGIRRAKGAFIFFGEDDLELTPGHFSVLLGHLRERGADIIEGRKIWKLAGESNEEALARAKCFQGPLWDPFWVEFHPERTPPEDTPTPLLLSHFLARREVFARVMFDEDYAGFRRGFAWREETDFILRAGQAGFSIVFCPHTASFQAPTQGGGMHTFSFWKREYWILRNHLFLLRRHRSFIRQRLQNRWPWPLLLSAYGLRRVVLNFWSQLYRIKQRLCRPRLGCFI